jgi:hypothetical protein
MGSCWRGTGTSVAFPREPLVNRTRTTIVSRAGSPWRTLGCVLAALACVGAPRTATAQQAPAADVSQARELFVQASELRDHGDLPGALEKFKAAHALADNPITTFEVARTYAALGKLVEARDAYASIARLPVQADETERAAQARRDGAKAAEDLRARVPEPTVPSKEAASSEVAPAVPPAPPEAREPRAEPPAQLAAPTSPSMEAPPTEGGGNHLGPFGWTGFGVGAAGFLTGSIFAAATLSKASSISTHCSTTACEQTGTDAAHSARDLGVAAVVSYTVSALGVGVGVADILLYKRAPSEPSDRSLHAWLGVGAAGVRGSF